MPNQTSANAQNQIDPRYRNLAKGITPSDKLNIAYRNALDIDTLCELMAGFDTSITDEPIIHANFIVQRLAREIATNVVGTFDQMGIEAVSNV